MTHDTRTTPPAWVLPVCAILCAVMWGSAFPGVKYLYRTATDQLGVATTLWVCLLLAGVRFTIGGGALLAITPGVWAATKRAPLKPLIAFGLLQTFLQYLLFYTSMTIASGSLGAMLTVSGNFFWVILAPLLLRSPWPRPIQWLMLMLGATGVIWAVAAPGADAGNPVLGAALFLGASFCGSLALIVVQSLKAHLPMRTATGLSLFGGGLALLLCAAPAWSQIPTLFTHPGMIAVTLYMAFVSATAFSVWNWLTTKFPVNLLAAYRFFIPVSGVTLSTLFIPGESPGAGIIGGGILVLLAVAGLQRYQVRPAAGVR